MPTLKFNPPKISRILIALSLVIVVGWLSHITWRLSRTGPTDLFLVLGGGIEREIYAAQLAKQYPQMPILISQGSADPCIWIAFRLAQAPMDNVWLEKCARSTFDNYYFSIPWLQKRKVRRVRLITSTSHLPRARWMGQILLGAQGIWVDFDIISTLGKPGNQEEWHKTAIDLGRAIGWAVLSQFYQPHCQEVIPLSQVAFPDWQEMGFRCERPPTSQS
jgi:uncharacterized SAM-binding protein YcdF (DUF218 family)